MRTRSQREMVTNSPSSCEVLGVDDALVVHILEAVFPEFRALVPESLTQHASQSYDERLVYDTRCYLGKNADAPPYVLG